MLYVHIEMSLDESEAAGITAMDDSQIDGFLSSQGVGVLGLPTDGVPYMIPMSFGFDGDDSLFFTYVAGEASRKEELSERVDRARFLVYSAPSRFSWQSVTLTGRLSKVPKSEWEDLSETLDNAWHPDVFATDELDATVAVYRFRIETSNGLKHTGLPPKFRADEID